MQHLLFAETVFTLAPARAHHKCIVRRFVSPANVLCLIKDSFSRGRQSAGSSPPIIALDATGTWVEQPGTALALGHSTGNGLGIPPPAAGQVQIGRASCRERV